MKKVMKIITVIYEILSYLWLAILLLSFIGAYVCVYDIETLNHTFSIFYGLNTFNFDITFFAILFGIFSLVICSKFKYVNYKDVFKVFCINVLFIAYIVWYIYNVLKNRN